MLEYERDLPFAFGSDGKIYRVTPENGWTRHRGTSAWFIHYEKLLPQDEVAPWLWFIEPTAKPGYRMMAILNVHSNKP